MGLPDDNAPRLGGKQPREENAPGLSSVWREWRRTRPPAPLRSLLPHPREPWQVFKGIWRAVTQDTRIITYADHTQAWYIARLPATDAPPVVWASAATQVESLPVERLDLSTYGVRLARPSQYWLADPLDQPESVAYEPVDAFTRDQTHVVRFRAAYCEDWDAVAITLTSLSLVRNFLRQEAHHPYFRACPRCGCVMDIERTLDGPRAHCLACGVYTSADPIHFRD